MRRGNSGKLGLAIMFLASGVVARPAGAKETPLAVECAVEADRLLAEELHAGKSPSELSRRCDDETFLKRVSLDLIGRLPTPEQVTAFVLDPSPTKRAQVVDRLLANEEFAENWARYWRDAILYRRSEDRALLVAESLQDYLTDALHKGTGWDAIAKSFITATGDVRENGATGLIMAQGGAPEETTAEVARLFMGIQIQCANCHDHPTDRWKRQQFHELAAFFPRVEVRPKRTGEQRSFVVSSVNFEPRFKPNNQRRGSLEHHMPDLKDPGATGEVMKPKFFVTGAKLETGKSDSERRETLAKWIVSENDPWFAKAFVNRVWSELVGEGFYEPVDDMGPDRQCSAPKTLEYLSKQFRAHKFDVRFVFRAVALTEAYQRESRSRRTPDETPFLANCSQRLRADQLFDSLATALGVSVDGVGPEQRRAGRYGQRGPRALFQIAFGFDPSEPREEIAMSIPQALVLMNAPAVNQSINASRRDTALGRLVASGAKDEDVIVELYLRCLAREPKESEVKTCLDHVKEVGARGEAFEDILWALINSTEFVHRK